MGGTGQRGEGGFGTFVFAAEGQRGKGSRDGIFESVLSGGGRDSGEMPPEWIDHGVERSETDD